MNHVGHSVAIDAPMTNDTDLFSVLTQFNPRKVRASNHRGNDHRMKVNFRA